MNYGTFYQRFMAMWIDFFVTVPFIVIYELLGGYSKTGAYLLAIPASFGYAAYMIYLHGRFGQTLGKKIMKIQVVTLNGTRIGWKEAWLRSSVDVVLSSVNFGVILLTITKTSDAKWYVPLFERWTNIQEILPAWVAWVDGFMILWTFSEVIVMLLNQQRRALHDFIAGTAVISLKPAPNPDAAT
jgi:uncharacterized RDD family membrane protein YckC